jgi:hypothetical protein
MDVGVRVVGLEDALKAMSEAFPSNPREQRRILNGAMGASARRNILPEAKGMALAGDGSGALSESLGVRGMSQRKIRQKQSVAGVEVVPVRSNRKALAMYIAHYYTAQGRTPPASMVVSGIRHGHLVEFGSVNNAASPFLWPAAAHGKPGYVNDVAADLKKKTEAAVRRAAKRRKK